MFIGRPTNDEYTGTLKTSSIAAGSSSLLGGRYSKTISSLVKQAEAI
jgi:hypothetical protein